MIVYYHSYKIILIIFISAIVALSGCQKQENIQSLYSGIPWYDNNGKVVSAHGANIIFDQGRYFLFGEQHSDTSNAFVGFNCYSSTDLVNWEFENVVLPVQDSGKLGPNRVGERVKVLKCPETGEYVMYMHVDSIDYRDQFVGYATSETISGEYSFCGPLLYKGLPVKKWDMGVFQDSDSSGYLVTHSGNLYKLSKDYKSISEQIVKNMTPHCESPAIFKKDGIYYWLGSGLTSWERNDNYYFTSESLEGPWTSRGLFAPKGSLTWNSQTSFVLTIAGTFDTTYMFMGDRWSFPRQNSSASYVWQPIIVSDSSLSIPEFTQSWQINTSTGTWKASDIHGKIIDNTDEKSISYKGNWIHSSAGNSLTYSKSNTKGSSFSVNFSGSRIGIFGVALSNGGYASVILQDSEGEKILSSTLDLYCKYPEASLKFLSPDLPSGKYTLIMSVMGDHCSWSDKKRTKYGSTGDFISLDKLVIIE